MNSSKKQTNEFVFTTMRRVFLRFLEEIEVNKNTFRNQLTFSGNVNDMQIYSFNSAVKYIILHQCNVKGGGKVVNNWQNLVNVICERPLTKCTTIQYMEVP